MVEHVTVEMKSRAPHPTVWLVVDYLGTEPPLPLFEDLEMIGWQPPVPAAPPATAIDWSTPNTETGERFTILPWRVEGAVIQPPKGSGSRGHWTASERDLLMLSLDGVLRRHGLVVADGEHTATTEELPATDETTSTTDLSNLPAPPSPATGQTETDDQVAAGEQRARVLRTGDGATVVVRAEVKPALRDRVTAALVPLGVTAHIGESTKTITNTYRGTTFETTATVLALEALVDDQLAEVTAAVLRDLGLEPAMHRAPVPDGSTDGASDDAGAAPTGNLPEPPAEHGAAAVIDLAPDVPVELRVLVPASMRAKAEAVLGPHLLEPPVAAEASVTVQNTYRGSTFETTEPGWKLTCCVGGREAHAAAEQLATILGIAVTDRTRIVVESPSPTHVDEEAGTPDPINR